MAAEHGAKLRRPLSAEQRYRVISQVIDAIATTARVGLFCGLFALIGYWTHDVLLAYAGQTTMADVAIRLAADLKLDRTFAYLFGGGGIAYGVVQRQLRRRNIARLTPRSRTLEETIDPHRTSSGLTPRGTTRPEDR
jgi:hypothetical protein